MEPETRDLVERALAEDVGGGDITADAVVPAYDASRARIVQKQPGVVFGLDVAEAVFRQAGAGIFERLGPEGEWREAPADVALAEGSARALLAAERTALNFLGHLSGIATLTARYVEAVAGTGATILDTRKTTPGHASTRKGGGRRGRRHQPPHGPSRRDPDQGEPRRDRRRRRAPRCAPPARRSRGWRSRSSAATRPRSRRRSRPAPSGCCSTTWTLDGLRAAVAARDAAAREGGRARDARGIGRDHARHRRRGSRTGVDFISVGALTHSAPALDLSMILSRE